MIENDPELSGKYLGTITKDFAIVAETLKEASYQMRKRKISEFPIFPIAKVDIQVGQILISKEQIAAQWDFYISFLDEFVQRKIVAEDKLEEFQGTYKDPDEFCCLFVVDEEFTNFVFVPYPEED